jgi:hypothetical protein
MEQSVMTSRLVHSRSRVCCVVCGTTVRTRDARMMDICGPVHICSRCPDICTQWPNWQELPAEKIDEPYALEATRRSAVSC